jgi:hypothetical protein
LEQARAAHAGIADPDKIRTGGELAAAQVQPCDARAQLDAVALGREVRRLTDALAEAERDAAAHREEVVALRARLREQGAGPAWLGEHSAARDQQPPNRRVATRLTRTR